MLKRKLAILLSGLLVVACSTQNLSNDNKSFSTKGSIVPNPKPSDSFSKEDLMEISKRNEKPPTNPIQEEKETSMPDVKNELDGFDYDLGIPKSLPKDTTIINIIFSNKYNVRVDKENKKVKSINNGQLSKLNKILEKYNVLSIGDLKGRNETEEDATRSCEEINKKSLKSEYPNSMSIHRYVFPEGTDFDSLLEELRNVEGIRTVEAEGRYEVTSTATLLSRKVNSGTNYPNYSNNPPSDLGFSSTDENDAWYHFRKHRVFESWGLYGSTAKPTIGIIDIGFDVSDQALDKPNYLSTGFSIEPVFNNGVIVQNTYTKLNGTSNTQAQAPATSAHGTSVASVAGSPINGQLWCGVLPSVNIVPVKVPTSANVGYDNYSYYLAQAIRELANSSVDVISISLADISVLGNYQLPIIYKSVVKQAIQFAISQNKVVAIGAGNDKRNLNDYGITSMDGLLIVGGSEIDTSTNKNVAWSTSNTDPITGQILSGSSYGDAIDMTASSYHIATTTYNPSTNIRHYGAAIGTSFSTPMVAVTAGMVKKINSTLNPSSIKSILVGTANLGRYDKGYSTSTPAFSNLLGKDLSSSSTNVKGRIHIRDLNMFNALIVAKNINNYNAITRLFNTDDNIQATDAGLWGNWYGYESYNTDTFFGLNSLTSGTALNFRTFNAVSGSGYTYGYQVYKNKNNVKSLSSEIFDGIAGVYGANNNSSVSGTGTSTILAPKNWTY